MENYIFFSFLFQSHLLAELSSCSHQKIRCRLRLLLTEISPINMTSQNSFFASNMYTLSFHIYTHIFNFLYTFILVSHTFIHTFINSTYTSIVVRHGVFSLSCPKHIFPAGLKHVIMHFGKVQSGLFVSPS